MAKTRERDRRIARQILRRGWLEHQDTWLDSETGQRVWGDPLLCDACGEETSELLRVVSVGLCGDCATFVMEAKHFRHSGDFFMVPDPRPPLERGRGERLSDPLKPREAMKVYRRDNFTCRYCGDSGGDLTVDHIDPEGGNEMDNYATACRPCNSRKGRRTPEEANMELAATD